VTIYPAMMESIMGELQHRPGLLAPTDHALIEERVKPRIVLPLSATSGLAAARQLSAIVGRSPGALAQLGYPEALIAETTPREALLLVGASNFPQSPLGEELAETRLWLVRAALAIRLQYLRTGEWPTSLESLPADLWPGLPAGSDRPMAQRTEFTDSNGRALPLGPFALERIDPASLRWNQGSYGAYPVSEINSIIGDSLQNNSARWVESVNIGSFAITYEDREIYTYRAVIYSAGNSGGDARTGQEVSALAETIRDLATVESVLVRFPSGSWEDGTPIAVVHPGSGMVERENAGWHQRREAMAQYGDQRGGFHIEITGSVPKTPLVLRCVSPDVDFTTFNVLGLAGDLIMTPELGI
jgi:hypothetical protein